MKLEGLDNSFAELFFCWLHALVWLGNELWACYPLEFEHKILCATFYSCFIDDIRIVLALSWLEQNSATVIPGSGGAVGSWRITSRCWPDFRISKENIGAKNYDSKYDPGVVESKSLALYIK